MGRHFDAQGRLVEWWTEETSKAFDNKSQCFIKQYSNFTMDVDNGESIHVNGKLTLGENLADNGGLGESFIAWKKRYDSDRESKRYNNVLLPGLEHLTPEQLFFVNFGRIWCHKATKAQAKKSVRLLLYRL
jgi:endothelin-converting enzyme